MHIIITTTSEILSYWKMIISYRKNVTDVHYVGSVWLYVTIGSGNGVANMSDAIWPH